MTQRDDKATPAPLSLRVEPALREQLEEIARRNDRSLSAEIRQALRAHVRTMAEAA